MKIVYMLVPLLQTESLDNINEYVRETLGIQQQQFQVHQLSGIDDHYALEVKSLDLHFKELITIYEQHQEDKKKLAILQEALIGYQYQAVQTQINENADALLRKVKKYNEIKEENKKLKKMLQVQLDNTEKVREQTQRTMKVLRQQFDSLVTEISKKDKNSSVHSNKQRQAHHRQKPVQGSSNGKPSAIR